MIYFVVFEKDEVQDGLDIAHDRFHEFFEYIILSQYVTLLLPLW